jgi:hypothetical protein
VGERESCINDQVSEVERLAPDHHGYPRAFEARYLTGLDRPAWYPTWTINGVRLGSNPSRVGARRKMQVSTARPIMSPVG